MEPLNLLLVEDDADVVDTYKSTIKVYEIQNECKINLLESRSVNEAKELIGRSIDAAIIDLKLDDDPDGGNKVLQQINERLYRFPVIVLTGTPDETDMDLPLIDVRTKGDDFSEILDKLFSVFNTGVTKIFGGRGLIEETMNKVFWESVIPHLDTWEKYSLEGRNIEKALIRYTISHLHHLLDNDNDECLPEEMYIKSKILSTGSILQNKQNSKFHIVVSPPCDMANHNGTGFKTTKVVLCEIEAFNGVLEKCIGEIQKKAKKKIAIKELLKNNYANYYHWLPDAPLFSGGFVNMRHVHSYQVTIVENEIEEFFHDPICIISPHFMRDIISRHSSYYARQGQPDFSFSNIAEEIFDSLG
mgnify:CR=1 FL=1